MLVVEFRGGEQHRIVDVFGKPKHRFGARIIPNGSKQLHHPGFVHVTLYAIG